MIIWLKDKDHLTLNLQISAIIKEAQLASKKKKGICQIEMKEFEMNLDDFLLMKEQVDVSK